MGTHHVTSSAKKAFAAIAAASLLTVAGTSVAFAADNPIGTSDRTESAVARHPRVRRAALRIAFSAAADALGMSNAELRAAMHDGPRSIAQVAGDQTSAVVDAVTQALDDALDQAVANGRITEARADRARAHLPERVERFVNWVPIARTT